MKKRIFAALSAMLMLLALAGCGAKQVDYDATCTISISCATILDNMDACDPDKREQVPQDGVILAPVEVGFQPGKTSLTCCSGCAGKIASRWSPNGRPVLRVPTFRASTTCMNSTWAAAPAGLYSVNDWYPELRLLPATRCSRGM